MERTRAPLSDTVRLQEVAWANALELDDLERVVMGDDLAETMDGCLVEPDGECPDGYRSPLLILGLI